jgi:hypothetical protein
MDFGDALMGAFGDLLKRKPDEPVWPRAFVEIMLEKNERDARQSERTLVRNEMVCRLLASSMPIDEISLILKIRKEDIRLIEHENADKTIPGYAKALKARRAGRAREAERRRQFDEMMAKR